MKENFRRCTSVSDNTIKDWELTYDTNFTITEITGNWAGINTPLEPYSYKLKGSYTNVIEPHSSVSLGFSGTKNGTPEISTSSLTEVTVDEDAILIGELIDGNISSESLSDADNDGLPDLFERKLGTDENNADSDGDNLPDGYEVHTLNSDPLNIHSFDDNISDGDFDSDNDGLSNYTEFFIGTNPLADDTDCDNITDGEEYNIYGTNPLNSDTDGDSLSDSDEINLNLDPLHADSANDGTNDSDRKFQQSVTYTETDDTLPVSEVEVSFNGTGYINSTTTIKKDDSNRFAAELVGIIGSPFSFESSSDFDSASISFTLDSAETGNVQDVGIVWFDEKFQRFRNVDCVYDAANSTVSANVPHFSTYCVVDKSEMLNSQSNYYFTSNSNSDDNDNDGIPDCYESTNSENPENEYVLSNGKTTFSLINEPHSDKQTSRDTIYDVVTIEENGQIYYTDGIVDGEEIVFSIGGDANCDGIINSDDTLLLQNYLSGNAELTDNGTVNSDCDLDGEITFSDIAQINYYIDNGSNNAPNNLDMGDLNNDGAVNSIDLALLMNALLGVSSLNPAYVSRADFTGDGKIDVNDYILMKNYLINNSTSIVGLNYFYYNSDPMKNDTDGDKDWDQADPEPTVHQLNGYFASKMGELQEAAKEYLGSNYTPSASDKFYGNKDVWLVFYYLRCQEPRYFISKWNKTAGSDLNFLSYINNQHSELYEYFKKINQTYVTEKDVFEDLYHFGAVVSALCYYPTISELLPNNISLVKKFLAEICLDRSEVNNELDTLASWGGDLQQLLNEAYESKIDGDIAYKVGILLGTGNQFSAGDIYADIDAEVVANEIKHGNNDIEKIINTCFKAKKNERYEKFSNIVNLNFNTVLAAEKIDLASKYDINPEDYRIFYYPNNITDSDYRNVANTFIVKIEQFFSEE
ncbi:MAG: dockerin type I domain-containing protein [Oscillospiraceae bacterium]|nr:dockerin type I domain-containing protein [Oscillospiraceae bacterium]